MSSISIDKSTKAEFDELKPENLTHDEFVAELLEVYRMQDTQLAMDSLTQELVDEIEDTIATSAELAAYRGTQDALESELTIRDV
jgi:hypothetical protein